MRELQARRFDHEITEPALIIDGFVYVTIPGTQTVIKQRVKQRKNVGTSDAINKTEPSEFHRQIIAAFQNWQDVNPNQAIRSSDLRLVVKRHRIANHNFADFPQASFTRALSELQFWAIVINVHTSKGVPFYKLDHTAAENAIRTGRFE